MGNLETIRKVDCFPACLKLPIQGFPWDCVRAELQLSPQSALHGGEGWSSGEKPHSDFLMECQSKGEPGCMTPHWPEISHLSNFLPFTVASERWETRSGSREGSTQVVDHTLIWGDSPVALQGDYSSGPYRDHRYL